MNCATFPRKEACIFTLGYEGASVEDFVATLKAAGVDTLVDVREFPISRKKGFSKNALREAVGAAGIQYVHLVDLGCPKPVRDQYKLDKDWAVYTVGFMNHLESQQDSITELAQLAAHANLCLVCFERDYNFCHRSMVAKVIADQSGIAVKNLGVKKGLAESA